MKIPFAHIPLSDARKILIRLPMMQRPLPVMILFPHEQALLAPPSVVPKCPSKPAPLVLIHALPLLPTTQPNDEGADASLEPAVFIQALLEILLRLMLAKAETFVDLITTRPDPRRFVLSSVALELAPQVPTTPVPRVLGHCPPLLHPTAQLLWI